MNNAICSNPSPAIAGRATGTRSASRSFVQWRGVRRIAGVISGLAFLLARAPVYAAVLLVAALTGFAGVLLFTIRAFLVRLAGGSWGLDVVPEPISQSVAIGGRHD